MPKVKTATVKEKSTENKLATEKLLKKAKTGTMPTTVKPNHADVPGNG